MSGTRSVPGMKRLVLLCLWVMVGWLLVGCAALRVMDLPAAPTSGAPEQPAVTLADVGNLTSTPVLPSTSTQTPASATPVPEPTAVLALLPAPVQPLDNPLSEVQRLYEWLSHAQRQEYPPQEVESALLAAGWIKDGGFRAADTDGDEMEEWLLSFSLLPQTSVTMQAGDFWILDEGDLVFRFYPEELYTQAVDVSLVPSTLPEQAAVLDFTGDGIAEVLLDTPGCGANTCHDMFYFIRFQDGAYQNWVRNPSTRQEWGKSVLLNPDTLSTNDPHDQAISMTYAQITLVDGSRDGLPDLVLEGGAFGSVGAGAARLRRETWGWDGKDFALLGLEWLPTGRRMHVLWAGNDAYDMGDFRRAKNLFRQVIEDPALENSEEPADNFERMQRFAALRLMLVAYQEKEPERLEHWMSYLRGEHPTSMFTQAGELLIAAYLEQQAVEGACASLRELFTSAVVQAEYPVEFGYANRPLEAVDLCPDGGDPK